MFLGVAKWPRGPAIYLRGSLKKGGPSLNPKPGPKYGGTTQGFWESHLRILYGCSIQLGVLGLVLTCLGMVRFVERFCGALLLSNVRGPYADP